MTAVPDAVGQAVGVEHRTLDQDPPPEEAAAAQRATTDRLDHRFEVLGVILLAVAAILTAWSAFQATKWHGVQSAEYSRAAAERTESVRASTRAGQLTAIDVGTFTSWLAAVGSDERAGMESGLGVDGYTPQPGTESAFIYERFRPELRVAFDAWLATAPRTNPSAAPTPFAMPEYRVAEIDQADELHSRLTRCQRQPGGQACEATITS